MTEQELLFNLFKMAELECLKKFERNFIEQKQTVYYGIECAFVWENTPEGHLYWCEISTLVN